MWRQETCSRTRLGLSFSAFEVTWSYRALSFNFLEGIIPSGRNLKKYSYTEEKRRSFMRRSWLVRFSVLSVLLSERYLSSPVKANRRYCHGKYTCQCYEKKKTFFGGGWHNAESSSWTIFMKCDWNFSKITETKSSHHVVNMEAHRPRHSSGG
jgi:hypothetical protein